MTVLALTMPGTALLELTPITGRKHQLRVHCAQALRCPIVGDTLYGPSYSNAIRTRLSTKKVRMMCCDCASAALTMCPGFTRRQ